ncbi:MAG: hypothetical protein JNM41_09665 [Flavipsychrobacter sp.]|nr:hypothetical protein [Flavipsychrobacter sp.]
MRRFLELKHWHLFLLIVICGSWSSPSPLEEIIHGIATLAMTGWLYAIGVYGHRQMMDLGLSPMKIQLFRFNVLLVGITFLCSFIWSPYIVESGSFQLTDIPIGIFSLYVFYAVIQVVFFVCKILAKNERKSEVTFLDYLTYLIFMGILPVGIWIIQPKVNRIFVKPFTAS